MRGITRDEHGVVVIQVVDVAVEGEGVAACGGGGGGVGEVVYGCWRGGGGGEVCIVRL